MKRKTLSVMTDFVFKRIFGDTRNIDDLSNFLKAVLPLPPDNVQITNYSVQMKRKPKGGSDICTLYAVHCNL